MRGQYYYKKTFKLSLLIIQPTFLDIPGDGCKTEGDPRYPDYVHCKALSDMQKV